MLTEIGEVKKETLDEQRSAIKDALNELEDNLDKLFEGDDSSQTTDYVKGDVYEIEQRVSRLCQNAQHVTETVEIDREDDE